MLIGAITHHLEVLAHFLYSNNAAYHNIYDQSTMKKPTIKVTFFLSLQIKTHVSLLSDTVTTG